MEPRFICGNLSLGPNGRLFFAGQDTSVLAEKYGTPLYLLDEDHIRAKCRLFKRCLTDAFGGRGHILYASKAASFKRIYEIMNEEEMTIDVVSAGELYTAARSGFPMGKAYFHGNSKTDADIRFAMESGIGWFVCDNDDELDAIDREAERQGICQKVLLRLTPGIDPHTHEKISTGRID